MFEIIEIKTGKVAETGFTSYMEALKTLTSRVVAHSPWIKMTEFKIVAVTK